MLTLLHPGWLGLLLLTIPVLLLHMRRRRTIVVGSTQIWRQVSARPTAQRTVKPPPFTWPLLLQLLSIALLAAAMSQPVWVNGKSEQDHLIVVLDNSIATLATGDLGAAESALVGMLESGSHESYSVLLTSAPAETLMAHTAAATAKDWLPLLPIEPTAAEADWAAIDHAIPGLISADETARLVVLAAKASSVPATLGNLPVTLQRFENPQQVPWLQDTKVIETENGLVVQGLVHPLDSGQQDVGLELSFRAFGDSDYLIWNEVRLEIAELEQSQPGLYRFEIPVQLPLSGVLRLQLADVDAGPLTQTNHVVHVQPVQARVLLLGNTSPELIRALAAVEGVALYTADNSEGLSAAEFDLVVTTGLPLQTNPETNSLAIIQPGEDPLTAPLTTHWSESHQLSEGVNWATLEVPTAARVPLLPGATEIFSGNGLPLVQARTVPGGRQVVLAFDPATSNWPKSTGFPAFMANFLDWVSPGLFNKNPIACQVGEPCGISFASLGSNTQLLSESGDAVVVVRTGPTVLDFVMPLNAGVLWPTDTVGNRPAEPLAVNAASVPQSDATDPTMEAIPLESDTGAMLWRYLIWLLLFVLFIEFALHIGRILKQPIHGKARRRQLAGMALRTTTMLLAALASLDVPLNVPASREQLVLLVGSNPSIDPDAEQLRERATDAARNLTRGQSLTVVDYGDTASLFPNQSSPERQWTGSNLQAGVNLALASLNPNMPGRVLLASNGAQTSGDIRITLPALEARDTTIDVLPLQAAPPGEVQLERVIAPEQVYAHDRFTLRTTVTADVAVDAELNLYRNGELLVTRNQALVAGRNIVELLVSEADATEVLFEVEVSADGDTYVENNRNGLYVEVLEPASILVITRQEEWGELFADALRLQGMDVTVTQPQRAPYYLDDWLEYQGVVLMDVPSIDLTVRQQELLEQTVSEHGRGLLILGGPNAFGPGGYYETVLEKLSPLSSRVPQDAPNVALVFVLDRSGSMQQAVEGNTNRLDISRSATITAAGLLHEESRVSVIVFDTEANVLVPLQERLDLTEIENALSRLEPGGGTAIYPGLEAAFEQLQGVDAAARHVIVMSDGLSQPGDFETLLGNMTDDGITVSVVAIGDGADLNGLQRYARMGGGAFHSTRDFRALPSILSQESMMLSGEPIEEHHAQPVWLSRDQEFVQGLPLTVPAIDGFVLTTPKDDATIHLQVPDENGEDFPLLASWRYGNGQVLAFTSQAAGEWTSAWFSLPEYPLFWSQALRSFLPSASRQGLNLHVSRHGDELDLRVELLDENEQRITGEQVMVNGLQLRETQAGIYRGVLPTGGPGNIELNVTAGDLSLTRMHHVPYPAALDFSLADSELIENVAVASGGRVLSGDEPLFVGGQRVSVAVSVWPWLLVAALILFLFELVNRYDPALLRKEAR